MKSFFSLHLFDVYRITHAHTLMHRTASQQFIRIRFHWWKAESVFSIRRRFYLLLLRLLLPKCVRNCPLNWCTRAVSAKCIHSLRPSKHWLPTAIIIIVAMPLLVNTHCFFFFPFRLPLRGAEPTTVWQNAAHSCCSFNQHRPSHWIYCNGTYIYWILPGTMLNRAHGPSSLTCVWARTPHDDSTNVVHTKCNAKQRVKPTLICSARDKNIFGYVRTVYSLNREYVSSPKHFVTVYKIIHFGQLFPFYIYVASNLSSSPVPYEQMSTVL